MRRYLAILIGVVALAGCAAETGPADVGALDETSQLMFLRDEEGMRYFYDLRTSSVVVVKIDKDIDDDVIGSVQTALTSSKVRPPPTPLRPDQSLPK